MGEKTDKVKGRAKEAVGAVADNKKLKGKGRGNRVAGSTKGKAHQAKEKLGKANEKLKS